jgi:hypothetical protein
MEGNIQITGLLRRCSNDIITAVYSLGAALNDFTVKPIADVDKRSTYHYCHYAWWIEGRIDRRVDYIDLW